MQKAVKVRFAPSPTGFLHIGGVRTALFNYLFAKHEGGAFLLRIEDTDIERSQTAFTEDILKSLQWLGLNWDEPPVFQSSRFDRYREVCNQLVESGHAYHCYCTPEEVEAERQAMEAAGKKPMYGGKCRGRAGSPPAGRESVIRFKVPHGGETAFEDKIRGRIAIQHAEIDDFVILRTGGSPTYNLACVVDDSDMGITHIVRGDDHINNTPKQVLIFKAMGKAQPVFAHLPMILGPDKKKLSKRHGAVSANQYRADGFLPEAVVNYLARLGWGHGDQEIFSREELIRFFTLEKIGKSNAVFNTEKLVWLNGHYIREAADARLAGILLADFAGELSAWGEIPGLREKLAVDRGLRFVSIFKQKAKTLKELAVGVRPLLYEAELPLDPAVAAQWSAAKLAASLEHILAELNKMTATSAGGGPGADGKAIEALYRATAERFGMKLVELAQPTRFLLQGTTVGPQLFDLMALLPAALVHSRLSRGAQVFGA